MDAVFTDVNTNATRPAPLVASWPIGCDYEQIYDTLNEARSRADHAGKHVLASYTRPLAWCDTIHVYDAATRAGLAASFLWEQPSLQRALVGLGQAALIETRGQSRFSDAASAWDTMLDSAVIRHARQHITEGCGGPLLCGGFAFDPQAPRTSLWEAFPDGLLVLPRILLRRHGDAATLTINRLVDAHDTIEHEASEMVALLERLRASVEETPPPPDDTAQASGPLDVHSLRPAAEWIELVADTVSLIRQGAFQKIVLALGMKVANHNAAVPFDEIAVLRRLRQSYPGASLFAFRRGQQSFLGATPERLVCVQNGRLQTMALAGSAPRGGTEAEDERIGAELLGSGKNQDEHTIVLNEICAALEALCTKVWCAHEPRLLKLRNVQHLETPLIGELLPGRGILDVVEGLHPTSAVGGFPRQAALEVIRSGEKLDRGWYAGPIGWLDARGNGEFAVALRSGLLDTHEATLFAGCGIVADSDPQSEYAEAELKLKVMLRGLGGQE